MRYCPICYGHKAIRNLIYDAKYFWKHKIKGEPEPEFNPVEVMASLIPAVMMASVIGKAAKDIQDAIKENDEKK